MYLSIIVSGYGFNLLIYPVSDADIRIRISAEGDIRNQIQTISAYPYPTTAQKPYPDNPWSPPPKPSALLSPSAPSKLPVGISLTNAPPSPRPDTFPELPSSMKDAKEFPCFYTELDMPPILFTVLALAVTMLMVTRSWWLFSYSNRKVATRASRGSPRARHGASRKTSLVPS